MAAESGPEAQVGVNGGFTHSKAVKLESVHVYSADNTRRNFYCPKISEISLDHRIDVENKAIYTFTIHTDVTQLTDGGGGQSQRRS